MACHDLTHTRNFRLSEHTVNIFPVSLMKLVRHWSHIFWVATHETYATFASPSGGRVEKEKEKDMKDDCKAFCICKTFASPSRSSVEKEKEKNKSHPFS